MNMMAGTSVDAMKNLYRYPCESRSCPLQNQYEESKPGFFKSDRLQPHRRVEDDVADIASKLATNYFDSDITTIFLDLSLAL
jgi:hypothetical protein